MIDRAAVAAAWDRIAHMLDPLHDDAEADSLLRDPAAERAGIDRALSHIELVNATSGGAIDALGYGFVRDPGLWRRATEATFQARALQQISQWWSINRGDAPALTNVVVRHSFATSFAFGTPQHIPSDDIHFIVVPFVYLEFLMLSAKALNAMLAGDEEGDAWAALSAAPPLAPEVPPAMKQLFARMLSDHAFHAAAPGENPTVRLKAQSRWLHYDEGERAPGALETHLSYAALDFAMAHELGHRLIHTLHPEVTEATRLEEMADLVGFRLFAASWGWRDDIFAGCPLSEAARNLLGPLWFFYSATLLFTLRQLLGARVRAFAPSAALARALDRQGRHLTLLTGRWSRQQETMDQYMEVLTKFGASLSDGDSVLIERLASALLVFNESLPLWVEAIPEADLRFAVAMREV